MKRRDGFGARAPGSSSMPPWPDYGENAYFEIWDKPRIQPRKIADFIGSSAERETDFPRTALGQPAQPGNSNRQNSWHVGPDVPSTEILPSRHSTFSISIWGMMLPFMRAGAQRSQSPMIAELEAVMEPQWNFGLRLAVQNRSPKEIFWEAPVAGPLHRWFAERARWSRRQSSFMFHCVAWATDRPCITVP